MVEFQIKLALSQYFIPALCSGVLLLGFVLYLYMFLNTREKLHLVMMFMGFVGFGFVFSEAMILTAGWMYNASAGLQWHRIEQIFATGFIVAIPSLLYTLLGLTPKWQRINRYIIPASAMVWLGFIIISFVLPDHFVSMTQHRANWLIDQADHGRGQEGILYAVRDAFLAFFILYGVVCFIADMILHRKFRQLLPAFTGLLLAIYGAVIDTLSVYTGNFYDFFPESRHARFVIGISLFVVFSMGSAMKKFLDIGREVEKSRMILQKEAERNQRQNDFIKGVLQSSSSDIAGFSAELSSNIESFTENTQDQAAATEEVSATIEQITAGMESVTDNANNQFGGIEALSDIMGSLSELTDTMAGVVHESLFMVDQISQNAKSGESSLGVMNESMTKIGKSSDEIHGIIKIINDISDRINLLSLNAAIEAARAGEAGRGFAVVADEISKLADQTAESIKNIDVLISTNESEIQNGVHNITTAVEKIGIIIKDIEAIVDKIGTISDYMKKQTESNSIITDKSGHIRSQSEQILNAMEEQKNAVNEINRTVGGINEIAQNHSQRINDITESSRSLVTMVERMKREISDFE